MIPQDPAMLLSFVNTWCRDNGGDFEAFLKSHALSCQDGESITQKLAAIDYRWDEKQGRFV